MSADNESPRDRVARLVAVAARQICDRIGAETSIPYAMPDDVHQRMESKMRRVVDDMDDSAVERLSKVPEEDFILAARRMLEPGVRRFAAESLGLPS